MATTIFRFEFDNTEVLQRLSNALDDPRSGFVFVQGEGTLVQQKKKFVRRLMKSPVKDLLFNIERMQAIDNEPNDTAAEQAKRFSEPNIVDTEE